MRLRRPSAEHPFGTIKTWMGYTDFLTKTLPRVRTEMSLHVFAYNLKRVMNTLGTGALLEAMRASEGLFLPHTEPSNRFRRFVDPWHVIRAFHKGQR